MVDKGRETETNQFDNNVLYFERTLNQHTVKNDNVERKTIVSINLQCDNYYNDYLTNYHEIQPLFELGFIKKKLAAQICGIDRRKTK